MPPLAASVVLYAVPTTPEGSDVVVTARAPFTVILRLAVAVCAVGVLESVTLAVKLDVPAAVGLPEICPVLAFSGSPLGRLPALMLQV